MLFKRRKLSGIHQFFFPLLLVLHGKISYLQEFDGGTTKIIFKKERVRKGVGCFVPRNKRKRKKRGGKEKKTMANMNMWLHYRVATEFEAGMTT